jgi:GH24 family phage-related lysozyme (muramidase)
LEIKKRFVKGEPPAGHLIKAGENFEKGITEAQASGLLASDVSSAVSTVNSHLQVAVSQAQFNALVSFTYNLGAGNLGRSKLLSNINSGQGMTMANFTDWNHAGGQEVTGLTLRRTDEYNLFSRGVY